MDGLLGLLLSRESCANLYALGVARAGPPLRGHVVAWRTWAPALPLHRRGHFLLPRTRRHVRNQGNSGLLADRAGPTMMTHQAG